MTAEPLRAPLGTLDALKISRNPTVGPSVVGTHRKVDYSMNVIIQSRLELIKTNPLVCDAENESLSTIQSGMEWRTLPVLSTVQVIVLVLSTY